MNAAENPCTAPLIPGRENLDSFRQGFRAMLQIGSSAIVDNTNAAHAKVILEEMVAMARNSFLVFCGCVSAEVWGSETMARNLAGAANRGVDVRFLVERADDIPDGSPTVAALRRIGGALFAVRPGAGADHHFAVADARAYRVETDEANRTAIACANDPRISGGLDARIRRMLDGASPIA